MYEGSKPLRSWYRKRSNKLDKLKNQKQGSDLCCAVLCRLKKKKISDMIRTAGRLREVGQQ